ncbi:NAD-dependent epimerase/dehydratase family protein [uncultured Nocardioides sp.]|uniref:NAD-dependent epimerase/dehydratase family protein n=1 Tax=uncultured Nocardioides sp. TaxID=198441 RepID=UPI00262B7746|nr:NAD-dependent epimerase/dehydratase family protein [uncultured Nocardioides sp.]
MRIAITGATGTLGTALVRRLLAADARTEIMGLARRLPVGTTARSAGQGRLRWTTVDLGDETCVPRLRAAFYDVDAVVHLAWGHSPADRTSRLERVGVGGTGRVMAAATSQRVPHVVHLSSAAAYSPKVDDRPVGEAYPTGGIDGSAYSRHKVAVERLLDDEHPGLRGPAGGSGPPAVTRMRPGFAGHHPSSGDRAPGRRAVGWLPLLPLDRLLVLPVVHPDDVADAVVRALVRRAAGSFNLAAPLPVTPPIIAAALGGRAVHVPAGIVRAVAAASWWSRVHPIDPGWVDLAMQVPLLDTGRAEAELGWSPVHGAEAVLSGLLATLRPTPAAGPRTEHRTGVDAGHGTDLR